MYSYHSSIVDTESTFLLNNATLKCAEVTQRFDHLIHFVSLQKRSILIGILVLKRDSFSKDWSDG